MCGRKKIKTFIQHFSKPNVFKRKEWWLIQNMYQSKGTRQRSCILNQEGEESSFLPASSLPSRCLSFSKGLWSPSVLLSPQVIAGLGYGCHHRQRCIRLYFHWSVSFFGGDCWVYFFIWIQDIINPMPHIKDRNIWFYKCLFFASTSLCKKEDERIC